MKESWVSLTKIEADKVDYGMKGISGMQDNGDSFDAAGWCTGIFEVCQGRREHGRTVYGGPGDRHGEEGVSLEGGSS